MFVIERHERIIAELARTGFVIVREMAVQLGVTEVTVRRDMASLARQGLLTRVHGGAVTRSPLDRSTVLEPPTGRSSRLQLGMVVPSLDYYWPQIVVGARTAAAALGATITLRSSTNDASDQRRHYASLAYSGRVQGLLVSPTVEGEDGAALLRWLDALPMPVMLLERRVPAALHRLQLSWVATDHAAGAARAVEHFAESDHRRIGLIAAAASPTTSHLERGWRASLADRGLGRGVLRRHSLADLDDREGFFDGVLDECRESGTTALLVHADPVALLLEQHFATRRVAVPDDMGLIAYDDEIAQNGEPPLTALRPPKQHLGRIAAETLVAHIDEGSRRPPQHTELTPELMVRGSSVRGTRRSSRNRD